MKVKGFLSIGAVVAAVSGVVGSVALVAALQREQSDEPSAGSGAVAASASDLSESCDLNAVPSLPTTDQQVRDALKDNPASMASSADPMTEAEAIAAARQMSATPQDTSDSGAKGPESTSLPAAAAQVPFKVADSWIGGSATGSVVADSRCVWAVTVHGPFTPRSYPKGYKPRSFSAFTVLYDAGSGQYLGVSAGSDAKDLVADQTEK